MPRNSVVLLLAMVFFPLISPAQPYKDPKLPIEERVDDLVGRMSTEEKAWQLFMIPYDPAAGVTKLSKGIFGLQIGVGADAHAAAESINAIQRYFVTQTRLGIPIIAFDEALHGLARPGATAFPQSIGLAASFDVQMIQLSAFAIAEECRSRGIRQVLSPVLNIASDVRWGRTEETYGEDPFLASTMGLFYTDAMDLRGMIATPKHLLANVGDGGRDSYPIDLDERILREQYLPPFEAYFRNERDGSVMAAYNSLNGLPCSANPWLLDTVVRKEYGFRGFTISDAGGTGGSTVLHMTASDYADAGATAINSGLDVIFQTSADHFSLFSPAFLDGRITRTRLDEAVSRVLRAKFSLGLFENPYVDPARTDFPIDGPAKHRGTSKYAARESIVLLKNHAKTLPFSPNLKSIAVIGQDASEARLGGYSGPGNDVITILDGIRRRAGSNTKVAYSLGCRRIERTFEVVPEACLSPSDSATSRKGLKGEYFNNITFTGAPAFSRIDPKVDFQWTLFGPDPAKVSNDFYSVRWTGSIKAPETGRFNIGIDGNDGYRLYIGDSLLIDNSVHQTRRVTVTPWTFRKGTRYPIRIEYSEPSGNAHFRLVWNCGIDTSSSREIKKAVELARNSDVAVVVAGLEEGEFRDRASLDLPGRQEELIRRVAATGTPVVVVIIGGSAVTMTAWLDSVDAVLDAWYPGEAGGEAVAEVLFGDYSPAGRLPITFPMSVGQLPLTYNHKPTGRGDDYADLTGRPMFPFGFGLSYTSFEYGNFRIERDSISATDTTNVTCTITNTGCIEGDEVVQLYIHDELASVARPVKELKGFDRIHVKPGEQRDVSFKITPATLEMFDQRMRRVVEPGDFRIMIGSSSNDIRLRGILTVR